MKEPAYTEAHAEFDHASDVGGVRTYRYLLTRAWGPGPRVLWLMLNPSTADESTLDPTLRRCLGFTQRWGFDGFEVCNLYALRSTDPKGLWRVGDPVGPGNDVAIQSAAKRCSEVVVGWGAHAKRGRVYDVRKLLREVGVVPVCLGTTGDGSPCHPLYLRSDSARVPWGID